MLSDEWRVIVDWNVNEMADRELDGWLGRHLTTRHELEADIRKDITRSVDGVQRIRYSIRRSIQLHDFEGTNASDP